MTAVEQTDPVARSTFLIRDASGTKALGTGVLIGPRHVLTCAHVVKGYDQVGLYEDVDADDPLQTVTDMNLGDAGGSNDLALLNLGDAVTDRELLGFTSWRRESFTVRGFSCAEDPPAHDFVHGKILGEADRDRWLQFETTGEGNIAFGMSGSAVWCVRDVAVGIVVYKEVGSQAYAIPTWKICAFLGQIPDVPWTAQWIVSEQAHETLCV